MILECSDPGVILLVEHRSCRCPYLLNPSQQQNLSKASHPRSQSPFTRRETCVFVVDFFLVIHSCRHDALTCRSLEVSSAPSPHLVALPDILALLDALALSAAGVGVLETHAVLVLALWEGSSLVCAVDSVGLV